MKHLKIILLAIICTISSAAYSQVSVNINIGSPPEWGPEGYSDVRYYYLPDVEAYYDVQTAMFIYYGGGIWIHKAYLPSRYRNYDLYGGYKVVMYDYRGTTPYANFHDHKIKYKKGYKGPAQKNIGVRHSNKPQQKSSNQGSKKGGAQKSESGQKQNNTQQHKGGGGKSHGGSGKGKK